jgi:hypothetical protein
MIYSIIVNKGLICFVLKSGWDKMLSLRAWSLCGRKDLFPAETQRGKEEKNAK